jgi:CHAT domain-containing protein
VNQASVIRDQFFIHSSMDFVSVCQFFGGSIFPDELRGNFTLVEDKINKLNEPEIDDPDQTAALAILRATVLTLQGRFDESTRTLDDLMSIGQLGPRWLFRETSYRLLNLAYSTFPPIFWPCRIIKGPGLQTMPAENSAELFRQSDARIQNATDLDILERDLFKCIWALGHIDFRVSHEANDDTHWSRLQEGRIRDVSLVAGGDDGILLSTISARAGAMGVPMISNFVHRMMLEVNRNLHSPQYFDDLRHLEQSYRISDDDLGVALCHIMRGDNILCGPHTSPLILNLHLHERFDRDYVSVTEFDGDLPLIGSVHYSSIDGSPDFHDAKISDILAKEISHSHTFPGCFIQSDRSLPLAAASIEAALRSYSAAESIFERHSAPRGLALISLRKACILQIQLLSPACEWAGSPYRDYSAYIVECLDEAATGFDSSGDLLHKRLVEVLRYLAENLSESASQWSHDFGNWASQSRNIAVARYLGLMAQKFGDHHRHSCGSLVGAIRGYEMARLIFANCDFLSCYSIQALDALTDILPGSGEQKHANVLVERMTTKTTRVLQLITEATARDPTMAEQLGSLKLVLLVRMIQRLLAFSTTARNYAETKSPVISRLLDDFDHDPATNRYRSWSVEARAFLAFLSTREALMHKFERGSHQALRQLVRECIRPAGPTDSIDLYKARVETLLDIGQWRTARRVVKLLARAVVAAMKSPVGHIAPTWNQNTELSKVSLGFHALTLLEDCIMLLIRVRWWKKASALYKLMQATVPDYLARVGSPTKTWPWQRRLFMGLLFEHKNSYRVALQSFLQCWAFVTTEGKAVRSFEERRTFYMHPDRTRVNLCIARLCLYLRNRKFLLPTGGQKDTNVFREAVDTNFRLLDVGEQAMGWIESSRARYVLDMSMVRGNPKFAEDFATWQETNRRFRLWQELRDLGSLRDDDQEAEYQTLDRVAPQLELKMFEYGDPTMLNENVGFSYEMAEMIKSLPPDVVVVYTALSEDGLALFVVDKNGLHHASWNSKCTEPRVRKVVSAYLNYLKTEKGDADVRVLNRISDCLSSWIVQPIAHYFHRKTIMFVPSSYFALFPLQALRLNDQYLFHSKDVFQSPSLSFFHQSQIYVSVHYPIKVSTIARPGSLLEALVPGSEPSLPMGGVEIMLIAHLFGQAPVNACDVTREQFRHELETSNIVHVCTHGYIDQARPLQSYISLQEKLRVADLAYVKARANLVIFSACLSGAGFNTLSDDVLGFSHALLASGVLAYIGALWRVDDVTTLIHMYLFYFMLLRVDDKGAKLVETWHQATKALYTLTPARMEVILTAIIKTWDIMQRHPHDFNPDDFVEDGREELEENILQLKYIDVQHPYYWAPFVVVGFPTWAIRFNLTAGMDEKKRKDWLDDVKTRLEAAKGSGEPNSTTAT